LFDSFIELVLTALVVAAAILVAACL